MLELVKAQKFPKAAGAEDTFIIDPHKLGETMYSEWGKYVDHANHPRQMKTRWVKKKEGLHGS